MEQKRIEYNQKIREHLSTAYLLSDEKIEAVLPRFLETIKSLMHELENLSMKNTNDALSRAGHAMKGALLNLGLFELAEKAYSIEKHEQMCRKDEERIQIVEELKQEINNIL